MFTIFDGRKDFFQWDLNQKVIVAEKVDRVHFEISGKIEATEVKEEDGIFVAAVPNIILQIAGKLLVYAYIMGEGDEESITKVKDCFSINGRAKPPDYVYSRLLFNAFATGNFCFKSFCRRYLRCWFCCTLQPLFLGRNKMGG